MCYAPSIYGGSPSRGRARSSGIGRSYPRGEVRGPWTGGRRAAGLGSDKVNRFNADLFSLIAG
mgnify:FL=1